MYVTVGDDYDNLFVNLWRTETDHRESEPDVDPHVLFNVTNEFGEVSQFVTDLSGDDVLLESPSRSGS